MKIDDVIHGFRLIRTEEIVEADGQGHTFVHEKTGARLFFLETEDDNKVFSISFRTPPVDDTGVAHIVEHSVLCGSRKYPLKEPFVELVKGSLNTFLNAMTFPDKTMYPVASRNARDFQNLMDVYLDAVFYPAMRTNPQVLMQEGWHYELEDVDAPLRYSGVVYNEMKGALSAPDDLLGSRIMAALYPDTTYGCESGGDPEAIPTLTQEMFLDFHARTAIFISTGIWTSRRSSPTLTVLTSRISSGFQCPRASTVNRRSQDASKRRISIPLGRRSRSRRTASSL